MGFEILLAIVFLAGVAAFPLYAHIFEGENSPRNLARLRKKMRKHRKNRRLRIGQLK